MKRITSCVAAGLVIGTAVLGAAPVQADTESYLDALKQRGIHVTAQSAPSLRFSGLSMCVAMRNNARTPQDAAAHWYYPGASRENLLEMAVAAQTELCPDLVGFAQPAG